MHADKLASLTVAPNADHETRLTLPEAGVTITGVYGTDPARLQRMLRGTRLSAKWTAAPRRPVPSSPDVRREAPANGSVPDADMDRPWVRGKGSTRARRRRSPP